MKFRTRFLLLYLSIRLRFRSGEERGWAGDGEARGLTTHSISICPSPLSFNSMYHSILIVGFLCPSLPSSFPPEAPTPSSTEKTSIITICLTLRIKEELELKRRVHRDIRNPFPRSFFPNYWLQYLSIIATTKTTQPTILEKNQS